MHTPHAPGSPAGFTLVEMMVTLCIAGVLAGLAVPLWRSLGSSVRLTDQANGFLAHLYLARSEAIKRNGRVVMCTSADGASCSAEGGWEQGWIVFDDANRNGTREPEEPILQRLQGLPASMRLRGNVTVARYVSFAPNGGTRTVTGAFQAGTLTLCEVSRQPTQAREILINALGRPRVRKVTLESCD